VDVNMMGKGVRGRGRGRGEVMDEGGEGLIFFVLVYYDC
jgi:hypothetical protein